jgi:hypothetical protein
MFFDAPSVSIDVDKRAAIYRQRDAGDEVCLDARDNAAFATSQGVPILWRSGTLASRPVAISPRLLPATRARVFSFYERGVPLGAIGIPPSGHLSMRPSRDAGCTDCLLERGR